MRRRSRSCCPSPSAPIRGPCVTCSLSCWGPTVAGDLRRLFWCVAAAGGAGAAGGRWRRSADAGQPAPPASPPRLAAGIRPLWLLPRRVTLGAQQGDRGLEVLEASRTPGRRWRSAGRRPRRARAAARGSARPTSCASISALPWLRTVSSTRWASSARSSSVTGRPWQALRTPTRTLARLNGSVAPERLTTVRLAVSTVVNRRPHSGHWRRRRIARAVVGGARVHDPGVGVAAERAVHRRTPSRGGSARCLWTSWWTTGVNNLWRTGFPVHNMWTNYIGVTTRCSGLSCPAVT